MPGEPDPRAPMPAAPIKYSPDGSVDWGNMWDTFCVLAQDGGPPHRASMLHAAEDSDPHSPAYQAVVAEIIRGIELVSGLEASPAKPGWVAVHCLNASMAAWLADAIRQENVDSQANNNLLYVPAGEHFTLKGEIKNVITAVAKTTHYWVEHLPNEVKSALLVQEQIGRFKSRLARWFGRSQPA